MEANEYFSTYDALHNEANEPGRLSIDLQETCDLSKIVWSSFDFMTGPELRFVWETAACMSLSPIDLSGEGSINDAESLDSSMSIQSGQYEDIDDPLKAELTPLDISESMLLADSSFNLFGSPDDLPYLEDYMTESRSTTTLTNTTTSTCTLSIPAGPRSVSSDLTQVSPTNHDGDFGTPTAESQNLEFSPTREECQFNSFDLLDENFLGNPAAITSCVDSGIGGTMSTHSELSALCQSPLNKTESKKQEEDRERWSQEDDNLTYLLDVPFDASENTISDELFVSKFVLAEQICSTQLPLNPMMQKLTIVPSRRIMVASFIFSCEDNSGRPTLHAISFLLNHKRCEWFMARQSFFENALMDFLPRIKASMSVEEWDDVIVRATSELSNFVNILGILDKFSLVTSQRPLMIKNTLFSRKKCGEDKILIKVISGVLQSQGYCVIIGSNYNYVAMLLNTLALFLPEEVRWCSIRSFKNEFSPYYRLQAIRRSELPNVVLKGVMASWPICIADVDRGTVCMSAPYSRHRVLRLRAEVEKVQTVLTSGALSSKPVKLELSTCRPLESVRIFLNHMDNLPVEESSRMGYICQFMLYIENLAKALIEYVKVASLPLINEKQNAMKSSKFSLHECRKALDLQSDNWFHAILARAELLHPDISDFLYS
ncbi:unnamed protein product [Auanema sp. JU1783]|nr:unnamed protein product [Auanema sp. JU1783]